MGADYNNTNWPFMLSSQDLSSFNAYSVLTSFHFTVTLRLGMAWILDRLNKLWVVTELNPLPELTLDSPWLSNLPAVSVSLSFVFFLNPCELFYII
jgi:hypothetical protein